MMFSDPGHMLWYQRALLITFRYKHPNRKDHQKKRMTFIHEVLGNAIEKHIWTCSHLEIKLHILEGTTSCLCLCIHLRFDVAIIIQCFVSDSQQIKEMLQESGTEPGGMVAHVSYSALGRLGRGLLWVWDQPGLGARPCLRGQIKTKEQNKK